MRLAWGKKMDSNSVTTIYDQAVNPTESDKVSMPNNRDSTSSEEMVNTSDEMIEVSGNINETNLISGERETEQHQRRRGDQFYDRELRAGGSKDEHHSKWVHNRSYKREAREKSESTLREAETVKARIADYRFVKFIIESISSRT